MTECPGSKRPYHHGDLKEALLDAAHTLISEQGVERFSVSDACRMAGVSPAALYRHFSDRQGLIDALATRGYIELATRTRAERDAIGIGTVDALIGSGQEYVRFAIEKPALYRLMFGRHVANKFLMEPDPEGQKCYEVLLEAVDAYLHNHPDLPIEVMDIAVTLWALVHGVAALVIDRNVEVMAPATEPDRIIERATRAYFAGLESVLG